MSRVDEELQAEQDFDQDCINTLMKYGMEEMEAILFLGRFLNQKTGESWTLIQIGEPNSPKFFVPSESLLEEEDLDFKVPKKEPPN